MDLGLKDKIALVCGSSTGLGRAIADELAAEGASLILCARGEASLNEARDAIAATGAPVLAGRADLSLPEDIDGLVRAAVDRFGGVDILVTNAGGPPAAVFTDTTPQMWKDTFALTLESVLTLVRKVLPGMQERGWGRIVNITSVAVKQPVDQLILSNSIRAAVTGFARTLANEVAADGITVNNVMPGYTNTARLGELAEAVGSQRGIGHDEVFRQWEALIPAGRLGDPRELAALVAFLASERAAYITGTSIQVDGGLVRSLL